VSLPSQSFRGKLVRRKDIGNPEKSGWDRVDGLKRKYGGGLVVTFSNT